MIIDTKTVIVTLIIIGIASYAGLQFIRQFALSIAQENHDANLAMDMTEEARRAKRERDADAAASAAFAKVEPLLPASVVTKGMSLSKDQGAAATGNTGKQTTIPRKDAAPSSGGVSLALKAGDGTKSPPSSGGLLNMTTGKTDGKMVAPDKVDEESPAQDSEESSEKL